MDMRQRIDQISNMLRWGSSFMITSFIYLAILAITTIYVYGRLDYVRSGPPPSNTSSHNPNP
jgi:hypothetical protein